MSNTTDDIYDYPEPELMNNEEYWKEGYHYDKNDNIHYLSEMDNRYLLNVIKHFSKWDTSPLKKEATKRLLKWANDEDTTQCRSLNIN